MRMNGKRRGTKGAAHAGDDQLCIETQGRDILAAIVNEAVTEAMQLTIVGSVPTVANEPKRENAPTERRAWQTR